MAKKQDLEALAQSLRSIDPADLRKIMVKSEVLTLRVSEHELAEIKAEAGKLKLSTGEYLLSLHRKALRP